jgi:hypothetical protein
LIEKAIAYRNNNCVSNLKRKLEAEKKNWFRPKHDKLLGAPMKWMKEKKKENERWKNKKKMKD